MSWRRSAALAAHELRVMRHEAGMLSVYIVMPLVMVAFLNPVFGASAAAQGDGAVEGAALAVPGMAVLFALFLIGHVGFLFFREHQYGTWERLRATPLSPVEVILGKALPVLALALFQQALLFALGLWLFDLSIAGSLVAVAAVAAALGTCLVACGVAAAAYVRSAQKLNAMSGVLAMVLGGLGGSLTPVDALPGWAQRLAPVSPGYWAVEGYRSVIVDGAGVAGIAGPLAALFAFALAAGALAAVRFRFEETKVGFE